MYPPEIKHEFYPEYANGSKVVPAATHPHFPKGTTPIAWHQCAEMAVDSFAQPFSAAATSAKRLEYFNAITYVDQQIGRLLDALDESNVTATTAILFLGACDYFLTHNAPFSYIMIHKHKRTIFITRIGDHGWQTGQKNMWCKMSVFDLATRIPFMISAPWMGGTRGKRTEAFAEAVDIMPTLADLAGIPVPASEGLQGKSLVPVMKDPEGAAVEAIHTAALSQFPRCWQNETHANGGRRCGDENNQTNSEYNMCDCHWAPAEFITFMVGGHVQMNSLFWPLLLVHQPCLVRTLLTHFFGFLFPQGYSMRVATPFPLRYTEWVRWNVTRPDWSNVFARELYNHTGDTGNHILAENFENVNIADFVGNEALVKALSAQLHGEFDQYVL